MRDRGRNSMHTNWLSFPLGDKQMEIQVVRSQRGTKRVSLLAFALLALGAAVTLNACNYRVDHQSDPGGIGPEKAGVSTIGFDSVYSRVLEQKCQRCHTDSDLDVRSYSSVKANASRIAEVVASKQMPRPPLVLTNDEESLLLDWIRAGAPEFATTDLPVKPQPEPTATPTPVPTALEPTYASIRAKIFEPMCLSCHSEFGRAEDVPLDTLAGLLQVPGLINRTNPEDSDLIKAVVKTGRGRMPPERTGLPALTSEEVSVLTEWIRLGTPE